MSDFVRKPAPAPQRIGSTRFPAGPRVDDRWVSDLPGQAGLEGFGLVQNRSTQPAHVDELGLINLVQPERAYHNQIA